MRSILRPLVVVTVLLCAAFWGSCATTGGKGGIDPLRGEKYFKVKCNSCHPNGGQGAGPPLAGKLPPGPLKKSSSGGRHNVPDADFDSLIAYITPMMQPAAAAVAAPVVGAPVTNPAAPIAAPGMKMCNCNCQCPLGTPPGQIQACTCSCACPPG